VGTVRNQLKSVFQKTNTHRQSSLVSLLLGLPAF
jgi:DNA-binding CsgD family transcriptional regulator